MTSLNAVPKVGSAFTHTNGIVYTVMQIANLESKNPKYPTTVVYFGPSGNVWAKTLIRFNETMTPCEEPEGVIPMPKTRKEEIRDVLAVMKRGEGIAYFERRLWVTLNQEGVFNIFQDTRHVKESSTKSLKETVNRPRNLESF